MDETQNGFRGTAMVQVVNPRLAAAAKEANVLPAAQPAAAAAGPLAGQIYQNVQVLGDLNVAEFARVMVAITEWVAPKDQACAYCHGGADLANDDLYTKVVARRMLQMTRDINQNHKQHVVETGVTCYTCHRGQPVPAEIWFKDPGPKNPSKMAGNKAGQNSPATYAALASLPVDPFSGYLNGTESIRVNAKNALPSGTGASIQSTEKSYALMMHLSDALGVNCTFCHNSRAFASWESSTPQRVTAWHGLAMVRSLNGNYMEPLTSTFPQNRLGPTGDVPKVNCATCHQGVNKPLLGQSMLKDYPELAAPRPAPAPAEVPAEAAPATP
jgi:photosynthetic reaction center cytochrome c subunit